MREGFRILITHPPAARTGWASTDRVIALQWQRDRRNISEEPTPGDVLSSHTHGRAFTGRSATSKARLQPGLYSLLDRAGVTPPGRALVAAYFDSRMQVRHDDRAVFVRTSLFQRY
jgi:hypothetical protein